MNSSIFNDRDLSVHPAAFIVISGGTGGNSICSAFDDVCYVLPVSDDGGSSSEIIRVLGGPSIGYYLRCTVLRSSSYHVML